MTAKRLFILDALALAFRSHHAFAVQNLNTSCGFPTGAIFGSALFLHRLVEAERPDYLVVAADPGGKNFRHQLYKDYKAHRKAMPDELAQQLPRFFELFEAIDCPILKVDNFEADDVIGTVARRFSSSDQELAVVIVSGDKDFFQLIDKNTTMMTPQRAQDATIYDPKMVLQKFGCRPEQVIDALALIGDSSDNVPGVRGIGKKGALKLIEAFGSLEKIYENLANLAPRTRRALEEHRDDAFLSRQLVTIATNVDVHLDLHAATFRQEALRSDRLLNFYRALEFRGLMDKIHTDRASADPGNSRSDGKNSARNTRNTQPTRTTPAGGLFPEFDAKVEGLIVEQRTPAPKTPQKSSQLTGAQASLAHFDTQETSYKVIQSQEEFDQLIERLWHAPIFAFDTETTGLDIIADHPIGIALSYKPHEAFYVPLIEAHLRDLRPQNALEGLRPLFKSAKTKIAHNLKFDWQMMANIGVEISEPYLDTMIMDFLIHSEERSHGLDTCCLRHLNYEKIKTTSLIGSKGQTSMVNVPLDLLTRYACEDTDLTLQLSRKLTPKIRELGLEDVLKNIDMPLVPVLARMEHTGVYVDVPKLQSLDATLTRDISALERQIWEMSGRTFNLNSPKQLGALLFDDLKIHQQLGVHNIKRTKTGYATNESVLKSLRQHPLPGKILAYRELSKLKGTYVDALPKLVHPKTGRIHGSFHQTGTSTGRLSSSDPNLQNIPIRSPMGREVRRAFSASTSDRVLVSADYSQIELRLLAHVADEHALTQAFVDSADIHQRTAAQIFDTTEVTASMRSQAKAINFGLIYGMGPRRLAQETGTTTKDARRFMDKYFHSYPKIRTYIDQCHLSAQETYESRTITGRRRSLRSLYDRGGMALGLANNIAVNTPIQGSAADLIKSAMNKIAGPLQNHGADLVLQVHDELVFECPRSEAAAVRRIVKEGMETAMNLRVPLQVEIGSGDNWLEAH